MSDGKNSISRLGGSETAAGTDVAYHEFSQTGAIPKLELSEF